MALNKDIYKSPEEKLQAYRLFREKNCSLCKGCKPTGGQNSAFYVQMCFTAWLESEDKHSFAAATCSAKRATSNKVASTPKKAAKHNIKK